MPRTRLLAALLTLSLAAGGTALARPAAAQVTDAQSLVRAMHDRYAGKWYQSMAFTQKTTRVRPDGTEGVEIWDEYGLFPGRLRIETPAKSANGVIYAGDSVFVVREGRTVARRADRNPLMVVGFDVYILPPERSLELIRANGFPLEPFRTDTWQGRPAYVVGGAPGDLRSPQLWFDAERLVFTRMIRPDSRDSTKTQEIRFNRYEPSGGGWVAPEVEFFVGGTRVMLEEYSNVRVNLPMDPSLFDPERWTTAVHPPAP